jgi:hypothetical protein
LGDASLSTYDTTRIEVKLHRDGREMVGRTIQQERLNERTACQSTDFSEEVWVAREMEKNSLERFM